MCNFIIYLPHGLYTGSPFLDCGYIILKLNSYFMSVGGIFQLLTCKFAGGITGQELQSMSTDLVEAIATASIPHLPQETMRVRYAHVRAQSVAIRQHLNHL